MDTSAKERSRLFDRLAEEQVENPAVEPGTMMGFPCLRVKEKFFATKERTTGNLIVKLPEDEVAELIDAGSAEPFAPAGRVFREWAEVRGGDEDLWRSLLERARVFVAGSA